jgi:hypothetical protein
MPRRGGYYEREEIIESIIALIALFIGLCLSVYFYVNPTSVQSKQTAVFFFVVCMVGMVLVFFPLWHQLKMET